MTKVTVLLLWAVNGNGNSDTEFEISAAACRHAQGNDEPTGRLWVTSCLGECWQVESRLNVILQPWFMEVWRLPDCCVWPCTPAHRAYEL